MRPAVFLDRDGTIIEHVHHLTDPDDVRLIPGAAKAIRLLRSAGYACVVVTNQSVIGRGMLTVDGLERVHDEMHRQLTQHGAELDGIYYCPVLPAASDRTIVEHPDRKPGPGMLLRASQDLDLDLSRSWMIGRFNPRPSANSSPRSTGTHRLRTWSSLSTSATACLHHESSRGCAKSQSSWRSTPRSTPQTVVSTASVNTEMRITFQWMNTRFAYPSATATARWRI